MKANEKSRKRIETFYAVFNSPQGKLVLEELKAQFGGNTLKKTKDGAIDANACLAASGAREVIIYIEEMLRFKDVLEE